MFGFCLILRDCTKRTVLQGWYTPEGMEGRGWANVQQSTVQQDGLSNTGVPLNRPKVPMEALLSGCVYTGRCRRKVAGGGGLQSVQTVGHQREVSTKECNGAWKPLHLTIGTSNCLGFPTQNGPPILSPSARRAYGTRTVQQRVSHSLP